MASQNKLLTEQIIELTTFGQNQKITINELSEKLNDQLIEMSTKEQEKEELIMKYQEN